MTAARLTAAEARRLGLDPGPARTGRTTRKVARGPYHTRCRTCGEQFTTEASEERHMVAAHHARYELLDPVLPVEHLEHRSRVHGCPHCRCIPPPVRNTGLDPTADGAALVVEVDRLLYPNYGKRAR